MDDKSTQVKSDTTQKMTVNQNDGASAKSLNFLKILARTYYVEPSLPAELNSASLN